MLNTKAPDKVKNFLSERLAIGRFGTVDEIAKLALFLASEWAGFVAGSAFIMDGGQGRSYA